MAGKISDLTNMNGAASIDRTADFLEVSDATGPTSYKATPNFILGFTGGNPVSTTDTQTLTNKTLTAPTITTPTLTVLDSALTLQDNSDNTKQAQFQLSGITAGQTRTFTLPDASTTLVGTGATQTLTNKTLTTPTINNPTLLVDTIAEFTGAAGVTVDGMLIKDGTVGPGTITPTGLVTGTGSSWAWQSWTPTLSGQFTNSDWTKTCTYIQIGKTVFFRIALKATDATPMGGGAGVAAVSLPVTSVSYPLTSTVQILGTSRHYDANGILANGTVLWETTTAVRLETYAVSGSNVINSGINSTTPFTWTTNDEIYAQGFYEAA